MAIVSRNAARLETAAKDLSASTGGRCVSIPLDVRDWEACVRAVDATISALGSIDILVNGAAGLHLSGMEHVRAR